MTTTPPGPSSAPSAASSRPSSFAQKTPSRKHERRKHERRAALLSCFRLSCFRDGVFCAKLLGRDDAADGAEDGPGGVVVMVGASPPCSAKGLERHPRQT